MSIVPQIISEPRFWSVLIVGGLLMTIIWHKGVQTTNGKIIFKSFWQVILYSLIAAVAISVIEIIT